MIALDSNYLEIKQRHKLLHLTSIYDRTRGIVYLWKRRSLVIPQREAASVPKYTILIIGALIGDRIGPQLLKLHEVLTSTGVASSK